MTARQFEERENTASHISDQNETAILSICFPNQL